MFLFPNFPFIKKIKSFLLCCLNQLAVLHLVNLCMHGFLVEERNTNFLEILGDITVTSQYFGSPWDLVNTGNQCQVWKKH